MHCEHNAVRSHNITTAAEFIAKSDKLQIFGNNLSKSELYSRCNAEQTNGRHAATLWPIVSSVCYEMYGLIQCMEL
jgi:hypothetical protein